MNIVDAVIIIMIMVGFLAGFRRGLIKQTVLLVGLVAVLVLSFFLRLPVSTFMYKNLPFFDLKNVFNGASILNIIIYELIAFLIVFSILYLALRILLKISGIIESILKATIILGFFSKIGGGIVGIVEAYILIFIAVFIFNQPFVHVTGLGESRLTPLILEKTPVLSEATNNIRLSIKGLDSLYKLYKNNDRKFNDEAIKLFIKYDIITEENVQILKEKGKLD